MNMMMSLPGTTAGQHAFSQVPQADIPRSSFVRSAGYKTTFNAGDLVPFFVDEVLPGDTFNLRTTLFARLATPLVPFMDNLYLDTFFFFVPNRLVWDNWEKFNGAQTNPGASTDYVIPVCTPTTNYAAGSLQDYMGLPTDAINYSHSALPLRAYNLIYNEWFRDQNMQNSLTVPTGDGPDATSTFAIRKRGKRHDYFTSSLPWPQKGPSVTLPLGTSAPVASDGTTPKMRVGTGSLLNMTYNNDTLSRLNLVTPPGSPGDVNFGPAGTTSTGLYADLTTATAATINQLRQSFQIQKLYERDARGGTRYTEIILAHFGVKSDDARLQRPEYLGGGSVPVVVNPIAQTSAATSQPTPQGNLAAVGTASVHGHGFVKSFTEHGHIIGILNVRADLNYQQGLDRMWSRSTRFDFYWPALSHIGEQAILNKEIYCKGVSADADVFGYQERYAEYRYKPSKITGQFRSTYATPLDQWHLAEKFTSLPALNSTFITSNPPMSRVKAVTTYPDFLLDGWIDLKCARPMPVYSVPGQIDHF